MSEYTVVPVEMVDEAEVVAEWVEDVKQALRDREPREDQWRVAVAQFLGRLEREDAGVRDSQLDFSHSMEIAEQTISRLVNPVMGYRRVFAPKERTPAGRDFAQQIERFADWVTDRTSLLRVMDHVARSAVVYGTGWVQLGWKNEMKRVKEWAEEEEVDPVTGAVTLVRVEVEREVPKRVGCYEEVLHTPNVIYPEESGDDPEGAPWICIQYREWPDRIKAKMRSGDYRKDVQVAKLARVKRRDEDLYLDSVEAETGGSALATDSGPVTLWEIKRPHPETGVETIIWVEPESATVLNWVENWYHDDQRCLLRFSFGEILNSMDGISLMYKMEPMHRAYSAILNQILDHGTRSIEKLLVVMKRLNIGEYFKNGRLMTGVVEADVMSGEDLHNGIREISLAQGMSELQWVMQLLLNHMQNVSNIAAAFFGHELADRPTAAGTQQIIGEAKQPLSLMLERWLEFIARILEVKIGRYRQFYPDGLQYYLESLNPQEAMMLEHTLTWPEGYWRDQVLIETRVSSQAMSKEVRKQEFSMMVQQLPDVIDRIMAISQAATSGSPVAMLAAQLAQVYLGQVREYLEEFDVAGSEALAPENVNMAMMAGAQYAQMVQQAQQQVQQLSGQLQQLQMQMQGPPPGMPPGGPPGMGGPPGGPGGGPPPPPGPPGMGSPPGGPPMPPG